MSDNDDYGLIPLAIPRRFFRDKSVFVHLPAVPHEFYHEIGAVAVLWGNFEPLFDNVLRIFLRELFQDDNKWEFYSFKNRRRLYRKAIISIFSDEKDIKNALSDVEIRAEKYHKLRNALVHGQHYASIPVGRAPASSFVKSKINKKRVNIPISKDEITDIWWAIGTLTSDLSNFFDPKSETSTLPSHDRQKLQELCRRHLNGATGPMHWLPPELSQP